MKHLLTQ